jgi:hypothetical protein
VTRVLLIRVATWVVAFGVGALYGAAGTVNHAYRWAWIPVGLILSMIATGAVIVAVRSLIGDRWSALAVGVGAMVVTLVLSGPGAGGSVIVPESMLGVVWTLWIPIVTALVVAWPENVGRGSGTVRAD